MPAHNLLRPLRRLNRSSPGFCDQLNDILYGEEYKKWIPNIQDDDLVWFVDYLDGVCRCAALPCLRLSHFRLLVASILPVTLYGSVCANSGVFVVPGRYYQRRICFQA